jgi:hypothetical protein
MILRSYWHVFLAGGLVVLALAGLIGLQASSVLSSNNSTSASGSTNATVNVLPTITSITVSPDSETFGHCHGGSSPNSSTSTLLGYPNGECTVGNLKKNTYPITVKNTGIPAFIRVSASNAKPADHGAVWKLCSPQSSVTCTGTGGKPGAEQFQAWTAATGEVNSNGLTANPACDYAFDASNGCTAGRNQSRTEGLKLIGPESFTDPSTSWTVTITWLALSQSAS